MMVQNLVLDQLIMHWSIQTRLAHLITHPHTSSLGHINQVLVLQISCKHYWQFPCGQSLWSHFFKNHTSLIFFQCLKNSLFPRKNLGVYCDSSFKPFCRKCNVLFLTKLNYSFCRQLKWLYVYTVYTGGVSQEHQYRKDLKVMLGCVYVFNPLHPNISRHILHTVLYIFP